VLRLCLIAGVVMSALLATSSRADAAPLPGGTHFNVLQSANPFVQVIAPGCPIFGGANPETSAPAGANITVHVNGWAAQYLDTPFLAFNSTAEVHGTFMAADGAVNTVSGTFREDSIRADVGDAFIGAGQLRISGPSGMVIGDATLADLSAPPEIDLVFNSVALCFTR
jgi:hypothetical protein